MEDKGGGALLPDPKGRKELGLAVKDSRKAALLGGAYGPPRDLGVRPDAGESAADLRLRPGRPLERPRAPKKVRAVDLYLRKFAVSKRWLPRPRHLLKRRRAVHSAVCKESVPLLKAKVWSVKVALVEMVVVMVTLGVECGRAGVPDKLFEAPPARPKRLGLLKWDPRPGAKGLEPGLPVVADLMHGRSRRALHAVPSLGRKRGPGAPDLGSPRGAGLDWVAKGTVRRRSGPGLGRGLRLGLASPPGLPARPDAATANRRMNSPTVPLLPPLLPDGRGYLRLRMLLLHDRGPPARGRPLDEGSRKAQGRRKGWFQGHGPGPSPPLPGLALPGLLGPDRFVLSKASADLGDQVASRSDARSE